MTIRDFEEDVIDTVTLKQRLTGCRVKKCSPHKNDYCPGNANKIVEALHVFEAIGVETNFEKMIEISLKRMLAQSQTMLQQLIEAE